MKGETKAIGEKEALERALKALQRAVEDTDQFDHGNMTSWEIVDVVKAELRKEFGDEG